MEKLTSLLTLTLFVLLACSPNMENSSDGKMGQQDMATEESAQVEDSATAPSQGTREISLDLGEKIIENAYLRYETTNFEEALTFVNEQVTAHSGMVEYSQREQSSHMNYTGEYVSMTLRIPQEDLHPFIDSMDDFTQLYLLSQEVGRQDVTQNYQDNETRIAVLEEEEAALRELLQEQGSLEEILQIRTRLTEVISEREVFEGQNQSYDEQMAYSTVELRIQQTDRASGQDVSGFWDRLSNAFVDSFYTFITFMQNLIIRLVYFIPHLILLGVIGYVGYRIYKKRKNK